VFHPGDHGSTFGGNPLACAVADAALDVLAEEDLANRAAKLGDAFMARLRSIRSPKIREVRGKGLLIGVVLDEAARPYCEALMGRGVLCKDTHAHVIRFAPPLVADVQDLAFAADQLAAVLG
jgi:ornithine--oxo-acid transaminase